MSAGAAGLDHMPVSLFLGWLEAAYQHALLPSDQASKKTPAPSPYVKYAEDLGSAQRNKRGHLARSGSDPAGRRPGRPIRSPSRAPS
jgi:hypothetical protein